MNGVLEVLPHLSPAQGPGGQRWGGCLHGGANGQWALVGAHYPWLDPLCEDRTGPAGGTEAPRGTRCLDADGPPVLGLVWQGATLAAGLGALPCLGPPSSLPPHQAWPGGHTDFLLHFHQLPKQTGPHCSLPAFLPDPVPPAQGEGTGSHALSLVTEEAGHADVVPSRECPAAGLCSRGLHPEQAALPTAQTTLPSLLRCPGSSQVRGSGETRVTGRREKGNSGGMK